MSGVALPETLPFRVLLDEAMRRVRRHLGTLVLPFGLALGLVGGFSALLNVLLMHEMLGWTAAAAETSTFFFTGKSCGVVLGLFALVAVQMLIAGAVAAVTMDVVAGRAIRLRKRFLWVLRPRVLGTGLLAAVAMTLSALACLLPALYVVPLLSFTLPVMADEERWGLRALERSAELTRYHPRGGNLLGHPMVKIFVLLLVSYLLSAAVSLVVQLPLVAAQQLVMLRHLAEAGPEAGAAAGDVAGLMPPVLFWLQVPAQFLAGLISALPAVWAGFGVALLFTDCRKRKEGLDLEAALDDLDRRHGTGAGPPEPPDPRGQT
jgi:hypothetical protein